ncbi:AUGMIN subunit 8-like [Impatiens glandulifera]|uniref:AUGMIN subunit 8-like n=1 Tax=Impatiens glandulifera TaxID=253017 RepID=UPI001FB0521E|nr:AUGMIN subunit 8-like [Impatiens glandulifera]XP_047324690.1 AUGMIN subunit 8-like [Impatiens glandulifera]
MWKSSEVETSRSPLLPGIDKNNGVKLRSSRRDVSPRYMSPASINSSPVSKRAVSAERRRPSPPRRVSSTSTSTPVQDISFEKQLVSRKVMPEALWPSTMRSLTVSFQSDTIYIPVSKKEKPATQSSPDRALRPSPNVAVAAAQKASMSPRKRSPLKGGGGGKNGAAIDQSENAKPQVRLDARLVDRHRWPSRNSGEASSIDLTRSVDLSGMIKTSNVGNPSSPRRMSLPGDFGRHLQKSSSDVVRRVLFDDKCIPSHSSSLEEELRLESVTMSRLSSPNRTSRLVSNSARGISPSRMSSLAPAPTGGNSPSRFRQSSSPSRQYSTCPNSVLSFIVDMKRGKKSLNNIEDVHQLRLLYNCHLQWRFVNAQANNSTRLQRIKAERKIYYAWRTAQELWGSVIRKRTQLQQQKLKFKLCGVLREQMGFLSIWSSIEREHTSSLAHAIKDLQSSILQLPVTDGAMADVETLKNAVGYAVEVMQAMGSSISSVISLVDGADCLVSELAGAVKQERAMIAECEALLASTTTLLAEEYSLRTQLVQLKHVD